MARYVKAAVYAAGLAGAGGGYYYYTADTDTKFMLASASGPLVRLLDPELSHRLGIWAARLGLYPKEDRPDPASLRVNLWGKSFPNPLGLAAGFDKDAEAMEAMLGLGFGFVEVGSITPQPQEGNEKPRVFRLSSLKSIINRYGFNSRGADEAVGRLQAFQREAQLHPGVKPGLVAINLGKNKTSEDAAGDYALGLFKLGKFADFVVINISSPNTPGLRSLQGRRELEHLVRHVQHTRDRIDWGQHGAPPLLVKIAPDLSPLDKQDIAAVATKLGVDGLVIGNTTTTRPAEVAALGVSKEAGGLSGPPLMEPSTKVLHEMYTLTNGQVPLIGCGGVSSGEDAYRKIRAGASLVELYTAMAFEGPALVPHVKAELAKLLERDGFSCVAEAVGADHAQEKKGRGAAKKGWLW